MTPETLQIFLGVISQEPWPAADVRAALGEIDDAMLDFDVFADLGGVSRKQALDQCRGIAKHAAALIEALTPDGQTPGAAEGIRRVRTTDTFRLDMLDLQRAQVAAEHHAKELSAYLEDPIERKASHAVVLIGVNLPSIALRYFEIEDRWSPNEASGDPEAPIIDFIFLVTSAYGHQYSPTTIGQYISEGRKLKGEPIGLPLNRPAENEP